MEDEQLESVACVSRASREGLRPPRVCHQLVFPPLPNASPLCINTAPLLSFLTVYFTNKALLWLSTCVCGLKPFTAPACPRGHDRRTSGGHSPFHPMKGCSARVLPFPCVDPVLEAPPCTLHPSTHSAPIPAAIESRSSLHLDPPPAGRHRCLLVPKATEPRQSRPTEDPYNVSPSPCFWLTEVSRRHGPATPFWLPARLVAGQAPQVPRHTATQAELTGTHGEELYPDRSS